MGLEDSDIHIDKEPDGVIIYSNNLDHDSNYVSSSLRDLSQPCDFTNLGRQADDSLYENADMAHYEIKECDNKKSFEVMINLSTENVGQQSSNDVKTRVCGKKTTRSAVGNCKMKCTVPQPFALATEKRVTYGTRPHGAEIEILGDGDLPPSVTLQHQSSTKKNPVIFSSSTCLDFFADF